MRGFYIEAADVAAAYDLLIRAARAEAGPQMKEAWTRAAPTTDEQMTLEAAYPRMQLDSARSQFITVMRAALGQGMTNGQQPAPLPR
jgi:hypothetical protein